MSLSAAVLRELMSAGLAGDELLAACERIEAAQTCVQDGPLRTARQERNRRYYVSKRLNASYSDASDANSDADPSLKDTVPNLVTVQGNQNPSPPIVPPLPRKNERQDVLAAFDEIITPDRAEAVVAHRAKLRKPLTPHAARLLAKQFAKASDANEAADTMIARGWQGYEPSWAAEQRQQGPPHRQANNRRSLIDALDRMIPDEPQPNFPRLAG